MHKLLALIVSLGLLVGCNPESFLSKDKVSKEAGRVSETATVKNYARGLEAYALAAQEVLVTQGGAVESFTAGAVDGAQALGGVDNGVVNAMSSVYCNGSATQMSWMNSRDANDMFTAKGLGRNAGERILSNLSGSLSASQVGYYDGLQIQMVDGSQVAIPDAVECGNEVVNIPVGAPVVVFAGIMAASEQVATTQGYEYRNEACADADEDGTTLYRELVSYAQMDDGSIDKNIVSSEVVSSNCSNADQLVADAALVGNALSNTNIVGAGTFAGGGSASTTALEGALGDQLSDIDCREIEGTQAVDLNGDGTIDEDEQAAAQNFDTCGESQILAANENALDENLLDEAEWKTLTTECGGVGNAGVSETIATGSGNKAGTVSYPAYSGDVTYRQKKYTSTAADGSTETYERYGRPEAYAINCYRTRAAVVACTQILPTGYNASDWSYVSGQYNYSRTETVESFDNPTATPPVPSAPNMGNWTFTGTDCRWNVTEEITVGSTVGCPSGQVVVTPGERTTVYRSDNDTGAVTEISSSITTPPVCAYNCPTNYVDQGDGTCDRVVVSDKPDTCPSGQTANPVAQESCTTTFTKSNGNYSSPACVQSRAQTCVSDPIDGVCNNATQNACSAGTANDAVIADTSTQYRWRCDGQYGGNNSTTCSKAIEVADPINPADVSAMCPDLYTGGSSGGGQFALFERWSSKVSDYLYICEFEGESEDAHGNKNRRKSTQIVPDGSGGAKWGNMLDCSCDEYGDDCSASYCSSVVP